MTKEKNKGKSQLEIFKQLDKEFSLPIALSLLWIVITLILAKDKPEITDILGKFVAALFFVSFFTGQYNRVRKQICVEKNFDSVEQRLIRLTENLEEKTNHLIKHVTGGDSYFYYELGKNISPGWFYFDGAFEGEYTCTNIKISYTRPKLSIKEDYLELPSLNAHTIYRTDLKILLDIEPDGLQQIHIIFTTDNNAWTQMMKFERIDNKIIVTSGVYLSNNEFIDTYEIAVSF